MEYPATELCPNTLLTLIPSSVIFSSPATFRLFSPIRLASAPLALPPSDASPPREYRDSVCRARSVSCSHPLSPRSRRVGTDSHRAATSSSFRA